MKKTAVSRFAIMTAVLLVLSAIGFGGVVFSSAEDAQDTQIVVLAAAGSPVPLEIGENAVKTLTVVFTSSDPSIVEVTNDGQLMAKSVGTATITAAITRNTIHRTAVFDVTVSETVEDPSRIYYLCTACAKIFLEETAADHALYQCPLCYSMYNKCSPTYHGMGKCVDEEPAEPTDEGTLPPDETSEATDYSESPVATSNN